MLTDFVWDFCLPYVLLAVVSNFVLGPLWISNPWVEFSSVHAGSWPLLYFFDCVMLPSHSIGELCVLLAEFSLFWNCGLFPSFIVSLGC